MALGRKTGGRQPGSLNKVTGDIKTMVVGALAGVGGTEYLMRQAEENPAAFMSLVGRVLPLQVTGDGGGALRIEVVTGVPRAHDDD
jgi:hypothetical protein